MKKLFLVLFATTIMLLSSLAFFSNIGYGQTYLLTEDFNYSAGQLITSNGWTMHSGTTLPITVTSPGLSYSGFVGSSIGNAITISGSGEDDNKVLSSAQTNGSIYMSFMLNIISASTIGDYFIHFQNQSTFFYGRLYIKNDGAGNLAFAINRGSGTATTYTGFTYSTNTTYLMVIKYTFVSGVTNDVANLFINPVINGTEPAATITSTDNTSADATIIDKIGVRQGANTPTAIIDGFRVSAAWGDVVLPIQLESFTSNIVNNNNVNLNWKTSYELNNSGFEIYRDNIKIGFLKGNNSPSTYEYTDKGLSSGQYRYKIRQIDYNGNYEDFVPNINPIEIKIPNKNILSQNYPNPFNPLTVIKYQINHSGQVKIVLYDILGKEIKVLVNEIKKEGYYEYQLNMSNFSSGIYLYKIETDIYSDIKKLVLVK